MRQQHRTRQRPRQPPVEQNCGQKAEHQRGLGNRHFSMTASKCAAIYQDDPDHAGHCKQRGQEIRTVPQSVVGIHRQLRGNDEMFVVKPKQTPEGHPFGHAVVDEQCEVIPPGNIVVQPHDFDECQDRHDP